MSYSQYKTLLGKGYIPHDYGQWDYSGLPVSVAAVQGSPLRSDGRPLFWQVDYGSGNVVQEFIGQMDGSTFFDAKTWAGWSPLMTTYEVGDASGSMTTNIGYAAAVGTPLPSMYRRAPESDFLTDYGWIAPLGLAAAGAFGLLSAGEAAASVSVGSSAVPVGAMSVPGTYGAMSTTAAAQSPWWSIGAASEAAAGGFTLGTVTDALKTTKTAVDAAGMAGKLFGSGAGAGTASAAPAGSASSWLGSLFSSNPTAKGYSMETPQGLPNAAATPQNIVPLNSGSISPALLLAGLGLILYLVKS
jgi:hypothetical protein